MGTGRTYTSQCYDLICYGQPKMNGLLVITIHILIYTVLLNHKDLASYSKEFIQFVHCQFLE